MSDWANPEERKRQQEWVDARVALRKQQEQRLKEETESEREIYIMLTSIGVTVLFVVLVVAGLAYFTWGARP